MQGPNGLKSHVPPTDENHFIVDFVTTAGNFSMEVNPSWSPLGAEHFLQMALEGYYDGQKVFRVIPNFLVQFGYVHVHIVLEFVSSQTLDRFCCQNASNLF